jgi:hypothetical protein
MGKGANWMVRRSYRSAVPPPVGADARVARTTL